MLEGNPFAALQDLTDWRELQARVAAVFNDMGFETEIEKTIDLVRGRKEIDVWARDPDAILNEIFLIECKLWERSVHQEVVHAFLRVMAEAGASTGIIVSKSGFQSGAVESVEFTNLHLLTAEEFSDVFGPEWYRRWKKRLAELVQPIRDAWRLHFDNDSLLPHMNNMYFVGEDQRRRVALFHASAAQLLLAEMGRFPESYKGGLPTGLIPNPFDPPLTGAWEERASRFPRATVRDYFVDLADSMREWTAEFERFRSDAHAGFEQLKEEDREQLMQRAVESVSEETPIRVWKRLLDPKEYQRMLGILSQHSDQGF